MKHPAPAAPFLTASRLATDALRRTLECPAAGAVVVFEGIVRDHHGGRAVARLEYSAFGPVAEVEWARLREQARERFGLAAVAGQHRVGTLEIGECAVWIGVAASHRVGAFAACQWLIDEVKAALPIWKREHYADGELAWRHDPAAPPAPSGFDCIAGSA